MKVLTVSAAPDILSLLDDITGTRTSVKIYERPTHAYRHLKTGKSRYDWVILDQRDIGKQSSQLHDAILTICQCRAFIIPRNHHHSCINQPKPSHFGDTAPNIAGFSSKERPQPIESLPQTGEMDVLSRRAHITEYHSPCVRKEGKAYHKPQLTLVTNNTVRQK